jgi:Bacterial Ig-like domain (group 3)
MLLQYMCQATLTASVTPGASGQVTFYDGTTVLGTSHLNAGQAIFIPVLLPSGTRHLRAHYSGDSAYNPSNSAIMAQTVIAQPSMGLNEAVNYPASDNYSPLVIGDFNGDGKPDLAFTDIDTNTVPIAWMWNWETATGPLEHL